MSRYAYPKVDNTSKVQCKGATPHKCQDYHDEHPAGRIRNVPEWVFTGVKNVLVGVIKPESELLHMPISN